MMENLKKSKPLKMRDLRPSLEASASYFSQTTVNVSKILLKYVPELSDLSSDPLFQNKPRRQLPPGEKTRCYPVCASTIEEASITGNLHVHDEVYIRQLKRDPKELNDYAIPCLNDQLSNSRIRSAQALRAKDFSAWERREIFMLAFGTFHLLMNLIWALLNVHRGTIFEHGSLAYYFNILEKVRLASEKPDFHTLLTALRQILEGLIFNAWRQECGQLSLSDFAKANPKPEDIISIAQRIIKKYATPTSDIPKSDAPKNGGYTRVDTPTQMRSTTHYVRNDTPFLVCRFFLECVLSKNQNSDESCERHKSMSPSRQISFHYHHRLPVLVHPEPFLQPLPQISRRTRHVGVNITTWAQSPSFGTDDSRQKEWQAQRQGI